MGFGMLLMFAAAPDLSADVRREVARQECSASDGSGEIVVCADRRQQRRYQVTEPNAPFDPNGRVESVARERRRWIEEGDVGTGSCSPVGPGGWTGCMVKSWNKKRQQAKGW